VGLGTYVYIDRSGKKEDVKAKARKIQEKSPLDPNNFVDFKLKRVDPYNHNTSKCVLARFNRYPRLTNFPLFY
jgi:cytochrome-b5 reductase